MILEADRADAFKLFLDLMEEGGLDSHSTFRNCLPSGQVIHL